MSKPLPSEIIDTAGLRAVLQDQANDIANLQNEINNLKQQITNLQNTPTQPEESEES